MKKKTVTRWCFMWQGTSSTYSSPLYADRRQARYYRRRLHCDSAYRMAPIVRVVLPLPAPRKGKSK